MTAIEASIPPLPPGEPEPSVADPHVLLRGYLDYYRETLLRKIDGLSERELRGSRLPSGWSPLELVRHLTYVERRWLCWGFEAEKIPDPWGDRGGDERWRVPDGVTVSDTVAAFRAQCDRSREIVRDARLDAHARLGGRFPTEEEAPSLAWILFHLLQEYARHVGQLDVARELADGATGE
ncbi:MAG TPA: DinB family protein [Streptomyces sp.]|nr:DinB family protein [Streptomyces sp.]